MNALRLATIREVDNRAKDARYVRDLEDEIRALRAEVRRLTRASVAPTC